MIDDDSITGQAESDMLEGHLDGDAQPVVELSLNSRSGLQMW